MGSSLISATSNPVVTTASAGCSWITDLTNPASVALNQPVGYRARLFRPTPTVGNLNILAGSTLAAVWPVGVTPADVVNANGGTITGTRVSGDPTILT